MLCMDQICCFISCICRNALYNATFYSQPLYTPQILQNNPVLGWIASQHPDNRSFNRWCILLPLHFQALNLWSGLYPVYYERRNGHPLERSDSWFLACLSDLCCLYIYTHCGIRICKPYPEIISKLQTLFFQEYCISADDRTHSACSQWRVSEKTGFTGDSRKLALPTYTPCPEQRIFYHSHLGKKTDG